MSNLVQNVEITKHINPSKSVQDEYSCMITFHDVVYITQITEKDFNSNLFEFTMLDNLIYNCNHKQKVGDIECNLILKETITHCKTLEITLLFERDVKPMKKINESHIFKLQEKKLDYDDKIGLAMLNLRNEINFITIKPTTSIVQMINNNGVTDCFKLKYNSIEIFNLNLNYTPVQPITNFTGFDFKKLNTTIDKALNKFTTSTTQTELIELIEYIKKTYTYTHKPSTTTILNLSAILQKNYVDNIIMNGMNDVTIFIDETKASNNRIITICQYMDEFVNTRKKFTKYNILQHILCPGSIYSRGMLIEEIP